MISSSAASYSVKSTSDNRAGGCGLGPGGGAGHERGSTHSVQSLFNLENNVTHSESPRLQVARKLLLQKQRC
jgi:hypothetical protein